MKQLLSLFLFPDGDCLSRDRLDLLVQGSPEGDVPVLQVLLLLLLLPVGGGGGGGVAGGVGPVAAREVVVGAGSLRYKILRVF